MEESQGNLLFSESFRRILLGGDLSTRIPPCRPPAPPLSLGTKGLKGCALGSLRSPVSSLRPLPAVLARDPLPCTPPPIVNSLRGYGKLRSPVPLARPGRRSAPSPPRVDRGVGGRFCDALPQPETRACSGWPAAGPPLAGPSPLLLPGPRRPRLLAAPAAAAPGRARARSVGAMVREQERDPERKEAAARASGEEEEEVAGEEGLSDSDEGDGVETGSGREEGEQEAAAGWERSEDARLLRAGLPPAAVPAAAARDPSGRRPPGTPPGRPRMPPPGDQDRARRRRRRRRRDLLLSQLCFLASVALLLWSLSSLREQKGECSQPSPSGRCGSSGSGSGALSAGRLRLALATANRHEDTQVPRRAGKEKGSGL